MNYSIGIAYDDYTPFLGTVYKTPNQNHVVICHTACVSNINNFFHPEYCSATENNLHQGVDDELSCLHYSCENSPTTIDMEKFNHSEELFFNSYRHFVIGKDMDCDRDREQNVCIQLR